MRYLILSILLSAITFISSAQTKSDSLANTNRLKVYLHCEDCNESYFKRNLNSIDFVSDAKESDVHIFVTKQKTAAEGYEYGVNFLGRNEFSDIKFKLKAISNQDDSKLKRWGALKEPIASGLSPYVSYNSKLKRYTNSTNGVDPSKITNIEDPWNYWVFLLDLGTQLSAEKSQSEYDINGTFNAKRITDKLKLRSIFEYEYGSERYKDGNEEIESIKEEIKWGARSVFSLNQYFSCGISGAIKHSTYYNIEKSFDFGPAVEYNIFPWDKSDRKVFTLAYQIKPRYFSYIDKTVNNLNNEWLWDESLKLELILRQPWGEVESVIEGKHFLHNFDENSLELRSKVAVNIAKGFSLFIKLDANLMNDQRYIAATEQTRDEILLQQRKLATPFEIDGSIGVRYSFGSIYNNVVNHRM